MRIGAPVVLAASAGLAAACTTPAGLPFPGVMALGGGHVHRVEVATATRAAEVPQAVPRSPWTASSTGALELPELTEEELRMIEEGLRGGKHDDHVHLPSPSQAPPPSALGGAAAALAGAFQDVNPAMALILDVAGAYFSGEPLQSGAHDPNRTGFNFQQLEMHLAANVDPFFRLETNIVFGQFGVEVEEAYATSLNLPWRLQLRAGQFLTRFGRLNPTHPHSWAFLDQPLVNGKFFGSEGSRGVGFEVSWLAPLPWVVELVSSASEAGGECCARSFFGGRDLGVKGFDDLLYTAAVKQFFPFDDDWSLSWGLSGQFGPNSTGNANRTEIYGTDLYLRYRPVASGVRTALSITGEAMLRTRQIPGDALRDFGMYVQAVWNVDLNVETGVRYELVTGVAGDPLDPGWDAVRQRASAQLTYYPSHFSRVRLQGGVDAPPQREELIWSAMLGVEVLIGAHGAHHF